MSLRYKLILPLFALLFSALILLHVFIVPSIHDELEQRFKNEQNKLLESICISLAPNLILSDFSALFSLINLRSG